MLNANKAEIFIAHKRKSDGEIQHLRSHLVTVSKITGELASKIGLQTVGELIGLVHDFGKYSSQFQAYIKSATGELNPDEDDYVDAAELKGKIDHSTAGAQLLWKGLMKYGAAGQGELCGQILALCVASHHSGLIDCISVDDSHVFSKRMDKGEEKIHLMECSNRGDKEIIEKINQLVNVELVKSFFAKISEVFNFDSRTTIDFYNLGFLTKFLFSCLIDADRIDSAEFEDQNRAVERLQNCSQKDWKVAIDRLESYLSNLPCNNYVDQLRREISSNCKSGAQKDKGIFTLTVPTGGGKTLASLRFALHHALNHKLDRVIFIIPYTSIIEQNANVIRSILEREGDARAWILEHHSNLEPERQTWQSKLIAENWDAPIVITTMVQFLEALFDSGTRGARRLHQLANSVIIFDEIQTLPVNCVHMFCNSINFLVNWCDTSVVLCTATQPLLDELRAPNKGQLQIKAQNELAGNVQQHFTALNRTTVVNMLKPAGWSLSEISALLIEQFENKGNCLVVVNTKVWAKKIYQSCLNLVDPESLFHLSTNQCPLHRREILKNIKYRLSQKLPVLCISTQLIEAGVDIDFSCVVRFLAGLDSIAQAAGRCNRNGHLKDLNGNLIKGEVFVINPNEESTGMLKDIEIGKQKAERVLREDFVDLLSPEAIKQYFKYYFFDRAEDMVYQIKDPNYRDDNILNLLSDRENCTQKYTNRNDKVPLLRQAFMEAGKRFKAINAPTKAVIVQYGRGRQLVAELCGVAKEFEIRRYYELIREAQRFSVNVFENDWQKLLELDAIHEIQPEHGIFFLDESFYSSDFGLSTEPVNQLSFLTV